YLLELQIFDNQKLAITASASKVFLLSLLITINNNSTVYPLLRKKEKLNPPRTFSITPQQKCKANYQL
ncbi:hypothetical protein, partial [Phocaeicola plebeius]|uniref:hypothetical protein n=1 Tax=Phocaeicola plebeius TaxID=310297 RepID=UPI0026E96A24